MDRREFLILAASFLGGCSVSRISTFETPPEAKPKQRKEAEDFDSWSKRVLKEREDEIERLSGVEYDSTLKEYTRRYDTIAHQILDIVKEFGTVPADYKFLDDFIDTSIKVFKLGYRNEPKQNYKPSDAFDLFSAINGVVKRNFSFSDKDTGFLNQVLKTGKIDCDTASYLYLAVAEAINMPLFAVRVPRHAFVRFESDGKPFNWETTSGSLRADEHYIKEDKISRKAVENGVYLRSLDKQEVLAFVYCLRGREWEDRGELEKALQDYTKAIELDSGDPIYYSHRADIWERQGDFEKAINDNDKALELDPENQKYGANKTVLELRLLEEKHKTANRELQKYANVDEQTKQELKEAEKRLEEAIREEKQIDEQIAEFIDKQIEHQKEQERIRKEKQEDNSSWTTGYCLLDAAIIVSAICIIYGVIDYFSNRKKDSKEESQDKPQNNRQQ